MTDEREPSDMLPDEDRPKRPKRQRRPIAESEQVSVQAVEPAEVAPLTKEAFSAQIQRLTERAKAAGWSPLHAMAQAYVKRGMAVIEGLLSALENEGSSKKKD